MTRTTDVFVANTTRPQRARDQGADVFLSIHFNGGGATARGAETLTRGAANVNAAQDTALAGRIQTAAAAAVGFARVPGVKDYSPTAGPAVPSTWTVLDDARFANVAGFHPIRGCIQEVEFISNPTALAVINDPVQGPAMRAAYAAEVAAAVITDIENQP